jgi:recombination protein RecT
MSDKLQNMMDNSAGEASLAVLLKRPEYAKRFEAVLGERAAQFASSLLTIGASMKDVEPRSILGSAMIAAALDLPIDKNLGFAWIIPYKKWNPVKRVEEKLAQFQMGYKGYVQLAQRTSLYERMNATTINEEVFQGYDDVGEPLLDWKQYDPAKPVWGYFFGFKLTNGFTKKAVWTKDKLIEHAKRYSQSYRSGADIWKEQLDGMGTKTVISNTLRKWGPLSVQLQRALQADSAVIPDVDAEPVYPELEDATVKPEFSHPAKVEQEAGKKAETKKTEAKPEPKPEPKKEPEVKKEAAPVAKEEPKPAKQEEAKPEPPPATVKEPEKETTTAPVAEPEKPKDLSEAQAKLRDTIIGLGHSLIDLVEYGKATLPYFKNKRFDSWGDFPDDKALFLVQHANAINAGIKNRKK